MILKINSPQPYLLGTMIEWIINSRQKCTLCGSVTCSHQKKCLVYFLIFLISIVSTFSGPLSWLVLYHTNLYVAFRVHVEWLFTSFLYWVQKFQFPTLLGLMYLCICFLQFKKQIAEKGGSRQPGVEYFCMLLEMLPLPNSPFPQFSRSLFAVEKRSLLSKRPNIEGVGSSCLVSVNLRSRNNKGKGFYKFLSCWHLFEVPVIEYLQEKLFGIHASFCMSGFYTTLPILQRQEVFLIQVESSLEACLYQKLENHKFKQLDLFISIFHHFGFGILAERYN